jgi:hypothetical protein
MSDTLARLDRLTAGVQYEPADRAPGPRRRQCQVDVPRALIAQRNLLSRARLRDTGLPERRKRTARARRLEDVEPDEIPPVRETVDSTVLHDR